MKKFPLLLLTCSLALTLIFDALTATPRTLYSVKIKLPATITSIDSLPSYYKGSAFNLRDGRAELPECGEAQAFSVIFTETIDWVAKGNNVRYLKLIKDQPYAWYDLTLSFHTEKHEEEDKRIATWTVEKREHEDVPNRVPEHALVVITDPNFIETLRPELSIPGAVDIALPTIVFKESIDAHELQEAVTRAIVGPALDLDAIHSKHAPACLAQPGSAVITTIAKRSL